jgi:hypothetical protein
MAIKGLTKGVIAVVVILAILMSVAVSAGITSLSVGPQGLKGDQGHWLNGSDWCSGTQRRYRCNGRNRTARTQGTFDSRLR